jgi:hypothetical protein
VRKEGKNMGKSPPQGTIYVKIRTTIVRKPCPSLQDDFVENETSAQ